MKSFVIIIGIYIAVAGTLLVILSMPLKIEQEEYEAKIQYEIERMRKLSEERWPDMSEEQRENSLRMNEEIIRKSYEESNTFFVRFKNNLATFFIGLLIVVAVIVFKKIRYRELYKN